MNAIPNLIAGRSSTPAGALYADVFNPSRAEVIARVPLSGAAEVDAAVRAAQAAFYQSLRKFMHRFEPTGRFPIRKSPE